MGGLVSGITDAVSDVVGGVGDIAGNALSGVAANPVGAITGLATGNYAPLIGSALGGVAGGGGGSATGTPGYFTGGGTPIIINAAQPQQQGINYGGLFASLLPSLIQGTGGVLQGQTSREAAQKAADLARQSGASAAQMAQFRPVGTTTRFGTSNFQFDPTTGQMTAAGYTPSATTEAYQKALGQMTNQGLMQGQQIQGLAGQYLGESPEAVRQRVMQQRMDLLAPSRERELARILNTNYQTGTGGLSVGATGIRPGGGEGLRAANPRLEAYYNSIAQADLQNAATAEQEARNQIQFGQGLASQAYSPFTAGFGAQGAVETAAQQPLSLSQQLALQSAQSGANAGNLGLRGDLAAAQAYLTPEYQLNPLARALGSLGQSQALGTALGGIFGGTGTGSTGTGLGGLFGSLFGGGAQDFTGGMSGDFTIPYMGDNNPYAGILGAGETWYGE
jgi:hypothetical protein